MVRCSRDPCPPWARLMATANCRFASPIRVCDRAPWRSEDRLRVRQRLLTTCHGARRTGCGSVTLRGCVLWRSEEAEAYAQCDVDEPGPGTVRSALNVLPAMFVSMQADASTAATVQQKSAEDVARECLGPRIRCRQGARATRRAQGTVNNGRRARRDSALGHRKRSRAMSQFMIGAAC